MQKHDGSGNTGVGFGGGIRFWGDRNGDNAEQNMGRIMCIADVNSGTNISGALVFETASAGSPSEKVRITSAGKVGINQSTPDTMLHLSGDPAVVPATIRLENPTAMGQDELVVLLNLKNRCLWCWCWIMWRYEMSF